MSRLIFGDALFFAGFMIASGATGAEFYLRHQANIVYPTANEEKTIQSTRMHYGGTFREYLWPVAATSLSVAGLGVLIVYEDRYTKKNPGVSEPVQLKLNFDSGG